MPLVVVTNELPKMIRRAVAETIAWTLANAEGDWKISLTSDEANSAWDVEVAGPDSFHWARRFSGGDRDADVIAEALRAVVIESGSEMEEPMSESLAAALCSLAAQGIAFTSDPKSRGDRTYVVDRVQLKESEIVYLYKQGALTPKGIRRYLLTRPAA